MSDPQQPRPCSRQQAPCLYGVKSNQKINWPRLTKPRKQRTKTPTRMGRVRLDWTGGQAKAKSLHNLAPWDGGPTHTTMTESPARLHLASGEDATAWSSMPPSLVPM